MAEKTHFAIAFVFVVILLSANYVNTVETYTLFENQKFEKMGGKPTQGYQLAYKVKVKLRLGENPQIIVHVSGEAVGDHYLRYFILYVNQKEVARKLVWMKFSFSIVVPATYLVDGENEFAFWISTYVGYWLVSANLELHDAQIGEKTSEVQPTSTNTLVILLVIGLVVAVIVVVIFWKKIQKFLRGLLEKIKGTPEETSIPTA